MTEIAVEPTRPRIDRAGLLGAGLLAIGLFVVSWLRHQHHWTGFDLAIFDQGAWQIAHGRDHISLVERHVMADHFSPVLYGFGLLYRVVPTAAWLFGAQALALGATVLPMRGVARHFDQPPGRATLLVVLSSPLLAAGLFDFHPVTLAVPFLASTLLFALQGRPVATTVAAIAAALCRADLALVLLAIAIVAAPRARWRLVAVAVAAAAVSAVVPGRFGDTNGWAPHFGHLGASPAQALLHPWDVVAQLLSVKSLSILAFWVVAAGVAIVLRPRWLIALDRGRTSRAALPLGGHWAPLVPLRRTDGPRGDGRDARGSGGGRESGRPVGAADQGCLVGRPCPGAPPRQPRVAVRARQQPGVAGRVR